MRSGSPCSRCGRLRHPPPLRGALGCLGPASAPAPAGRSPPAAPARASASEALVASGRRPGAGLQAAEGKRLRKLAPSSAAASVPSGTGKPLEQMVQIIEAQPEDSSFDEILPELAFARMIERGLEDVDQGRTVSQEEDPRLHRPRQPPRRLGGTAAGIVARVEVLTTFPQIGQPGRHAACPPRRPSLRASGLDRRAPLVQATPDGDHPRPTSPALPQRGRAGGKGGHTPGSAVTTPSRRRDGSAAGGRRPRRERREIRDAEG